MTEYKNKFCQRCEQTSKSMEHELCEKCILEMYKKCPGISHSEKVNFITVLKNVYDLWSLGQIICFLENSLENRLRKYNEIL